MARRRGRSPSRPAEARRVQWPPSLIFPALLLAALVAYFPVWHGGLLWDDDAHLTRPALQSIAGLWRIWFHIGATQQYYPVAHTAFWLLYQCFGLNTFGYHLVNIALHATSAYLLWSILRRLAIPGALLAAFLFLLHPMQVESVAWMSELKNTLSTVFFLGAASRYLALRDDELDRSAYVSALFLFTLAVLSKASTVVWPLMMLPVLWWKSRPVQWRLQLRRLIPFLAIAAAASCVTLWVERTFIGAQGAEFQLPILSRFLIAGRAVVFYLTSVAWPAHLTFIYPRWDVNPAAAWQFLFPAGVMIAAAVLWRVRRDAPGTAAAFLAFGFALTPAVGLVDVYPFRYSFVADHFAYLATMPVIALVAAAAVHLGSQWRLAPQARAAAAVGVVLLLGVLTWRQASGYVDAETLYQTTLEHNPSCWLCHNNLAEPKLYGSLADVRSAVRHLDEALRLHPDAAEVHNNLGGAFQRLDRWDDARAEHEKAAQLNPLLPETHFNLGIVYEHAGRLDAAIAEYTKAIDLKPDYVIAHNNLALVLQKEGRFGEALSMLEAAVKFDPDAGEVQFNLGAALQREGRIEEAVLHYREALRVRPDDAEARARLDVLQRRGSGG